MTSRRVYPEHLREQARSLAESVPGYTRKQVAEITGVNYYTLGAWTKRYGWRWTKRKGSTNWPAEIRDKAKTLLLRGVKGATVAARLGIPPGTISTWKTLHGWCPVSMGPPVTGCDACRNPKRHLCSQFWCACCDEDEFSWQEAVAHGHGIAAAR